MVCSPTEQDPDLPRSASNVLGKVTVHAQLCLTEWRAKWKWLEH